MHLAPDWTKDPAWDGMRPRLQANGQRTIETIVTRFGGALLGPTPLTRAMIDDHGLGHASTLEALAALTAHGLLHARDTPQGPAFWVPDRLVTSQPSPDRSARRNGAASARMNLI